jgi:hypothetical protein
VSPWAKDGLTGELWNEPFGASLAYADLVDGADPVAFFARACEALQARELT